MVRTHGDFEQLAFAVRGRCTGGRFQPGPVFRDGKCEFVARRTHCAGPASFLGCRDFCFVQPCGLRRGSERRRAGSVRTLEVIRLDVIAAHGVVFELIPHENAAKVWMAGKNDAEEIEDFAFLKFCRTPDRRERWKHFDLVCPVDSALCDLRRRGRMLLCDGEQMVNNLEE